MRSDMEEWKVVRQQVLASEMSKRAACAKYQLGWHTLNKILAHTEPPGYRQQAARPKRVLASVLPIIHEILATDGKAPKKQRHTAQRIFERLKLEYGYLGGKTVVEDAVRAWRQTHQEVFLPLSHPPGEAQVDFGEATIRQGGVERKVALFVMTLPLPFKTVGEIVEVCGDSADCRKSEPCSPLRSNICSALIRAVTLAVEPVRVRSSALVVGNTAAPSRCRLRDRSRHAGSLATDAPT